LLAAGLNRDQWSQVVDISNGQDWLQVERSDGFQWQAGRPSPDMDVVVRALVGTRTLADKLGEFADMKTPALRPEPPLALAYRKVRRAPAHAFRNAACRDGAT